MNECVRPFHVFVMAEEAKALAAKLGSLARAISESIAHTLSLSRSDALELAVRPLLQMALRACLHAPPLGGCLTLPTDVAAVAAFMTRVPTLSSASSTRGGESGKIGAEARAKGALPAIPYSTRVQDPISKLSVYLILYLISTFCCLFQCRAFSRK